MVDVGCDGKCSFKVLLDHSSQQLASKSKIGKAKVFIFLDQ